VRLFFSEDPAETLALVQKLDDLNAQRQRTEERIFNEARERVESRGLDRKYKCLVLGDPGWHRGVIGIVASKLKDAFNRPVVLFHYENGKAHGSGRSISDVPLIDLLEACKEHFLSYGGHRLAVGCTLPTEGLAAFRAALNPLAEERIPEESLKRKIKIDGPLEFADLDDRFMDVMGLLVPFGVGNPKPLFMADAVEIVSEPQVLQGKHLKFLARQNGRVLEALAWDKADWRHVLRRGQRVSLAFSVQTSEYMGEKRINLSLEDLRI
jgi:single-stranded-DNA-specific exonuclease